MPIAMLRSNDCPKHKRAAANFLSIDTNANARIRGKRLVNARAIGARALVYYHFE